MSASTVVSLRLPPEAATRLRQMARRMGRTASEVGAELVAESLRRAEFAFIDFRDSAAGRQAYIQGTRLAVWQVISLHGTYNGDVTKTAAHLKWPEAKVHAAIAYTEAFPDEIEEALEDQASCDFSKLSRLLPGIMRFEDVRPPKVKK
ncbi:MAG: CopG family transcriptional regulator [Verrucomicrobiota bacterium]